jgi:hypothetical protein
MAQALAWGIAETTVYSVLYTVVLVDLAPYAPEFPSQVPAKAQLSRPTNTQGRCQHSSDSMCSGHFLPLLSYRQIVLRYSPFHAIRRGPETADK